MRVGSTLSHLHDPTPPIARENSIPAGADESCFGVPTIESPIACCIRALAHLPNPTPPRLGDNVSSSGAGEDCFDMPTVEDAHFRTDFTIYSTRVSDRTVTERLEHARRQGKLRMRWLRGPALLLGSSCVLVGLFFVGAKTILALESLGWFFLYLGMVMLLLSLVPTDVRCVPLTSAILGIPFVFAIALQRAWWLAQYIEMLKAKNCSFLEDVGHDAPCPAVAIESGLCIFNVIVMFGTNCYFVQCFCKRQDTPVLLQRTWKVLSVNLFLAGLMALGRCVARFYGGNSTSGIKYIVNSIIALAFFAATARYRAIVTIQSWLMSRGESATAAAGVAELLGGKEPEIVLAHARQSFFCVPASQLTYDDMLDNRPNPSLGKRASRMNLGHADAFLSHSWHDDPALKWAALQSWCEGFKHIHGGREPTFWIDKYCIDQNNIEESLACLPIYLAGCKILLVLCGPTYLSRLWCLIEIFVFLEMGGKLCNLDVRFLDCTNIENPAPKRQASTKSSGTAGTQSSGMFKWIYPRALRASASFTNGETLGTLMDEFDSRNARCFTEKDTLRLQRVLELTGATKVNRLVNEVFVTKLAEARSI